MTGKGVGELHTRRIHNSCKRLHMPLCIGHIPFAAGVFNASWQLNRSVTTTSANAVIYQTLL